MFLAVFFVDAMIILLKFVYYWDLCILLNKNESWGFESLFFYLLVGIKDSKISFQNS